MENSDKGLNELTTNESGIMSIEKSSDKKLEPEIISESKKDFSSYIKSGKILCQVWLLGENQARDKLIGSTKVKVGKTTFTVKGKKYWINYKELKEGKKYFIFDCDVTNAIGGLSFHNITDLKKYPEQAENMLRDGVVRVLMGKGGIPAVYLLVAFIAVSIALAGSMYLLNAYQNSISQIDKQRIQIDNLKSENSQLEQQLKEIGGLNG